MGPADLRHDLELLGLAVDNSFKVEKLKNRLADLDSLLGEKWDMKVKDDDRYFYANFAEFSLDLPSRSLLVKIKFAESTCSFRQDSYRQDTAADCCWLFTNWQTILVCLTNGFFKSHQMQ